MAFSIAASPARSASFLLTRFWTGLIPLQKREGQRLLRSDVSIFDLLTNDQACLRAGEAIDCRALAPFYPRLVKRSLDLVTGFSRSAIEASR